MQLDPGFVEVLTDILSKLPADPDALRALHRELQAAEASFVPANDPLAAAVARCVATLRERTEAVHMPKAAAEVPEIDLAFHQKATMALSVGDLVPPPAPPQAVQQEEDVESVLPGDVTSAVHWTTDDRLLYEDILNLFDLGDQAGAMTSLERLIMLASQSEELATFLDKNGVLLQRLYEEHIGSLDRVPVPIKDARPIRIPTTHPPLVLDVLRLVDGHRNIRDILKRSRLGELQTLASIAHMARSGFLEMT